MRWFKHMSDLSEDIKIKRLVRRFGSDGYSIYIYIIERVVKNLETDSPMPDLEENSADLSEFFGIETGRVEEIIYYCFTEGLLDQDEITGRVLAHKVYKFLEASQTKSDRIRGMIKTYKNMINEERSQKSVTIRDNSDRTEQNRTEQKKKTMSGKPDGVPSKSVEKIPYEEIVNYLNTHCSTHFKHETPKTRRDIDARWKEGFRLEDFKKVIEVKSAQWYEDDKMCIYLRPITLFGTKFESYLNEVEE